MKLTELSKSSNKNEYEVHFKNELGNSIDISVISKKMDKADGVEISISCPETTSTNHITLEECKKLNQLLTKYLKSK